MEILETINTKLKEAMKNKDEDMLRTMRSLKSALKYKEVEKERSEPLSEEVIVQVLNKEIKKRRDAIEEFKKANRDDLFKKEETELNIILSFLPAMLKEEEVENFVRETIKEKGASSIKDMGTVMKTVMDKLKGRADGKLVSDIVKKLLTESQN